MDYEIVGDKLIIKADLQEQADLDQLRHQSKSGQLEDGDVWGTWQVECEALEDLLTNSELEWIHPADTGDLTDAPMLGILGEESPKNEGPYGCFHSGGAEPVPLFTPINQRWAFMDYQLRSFLDDLADTGKAVFTS